MRNKTIKLLAILFAVSIFTLALFGCSNKKNPGANSGVNAPTQEFPEVSEIDAFIKSVETLKEKYDQNAITIVEVEDVFIQTKVIEGFLGEQPNLYTETEYKTKIEKAYSILKSIDIKKVEVDKEKIENSFNSALVIIEKLKSKTS